METALKDDRQLLTVKEIQKMGMSRSMAYQLLNRRDLPVVKIGARRFMHRDLFEKWLREQASTGEKGA